MALGLFIIATAINFFFTAPLTGGFLVGDLESWRLVCSSGAFFVGGLLILSTYGRYRKAREAKRTPDAVPLLATTPAATPQHNDGEEGDREEHHE
jgi:hypothetical protein